MAIDIFAFLEREKDKYYKEKAELQSFQDKLAIFESALSFQGITDSYELSAIYYLLICVYPEVEADNIRNGLCGHAIHMNTLISKIYNNRESSKNDIRNEDIFTHLSRMNSIFDSMRRKYDEMTEQFLKDRDYIKNKSKDIYNNKLLYFALKNGEIVPYSVVESLHKQLLDSDVGRAEAIGILEEIRRYNMSKRVPDMPVYNSVNMMMNEEFEKFEISDDEITKYTNKDASLLKSYYKSIGTTNNIREFIDSVRSTFASNDEFIFIIKNLINYKIDDILSTKDLMLEQYMKKEDRKLVLSLNREEKNDLSILYDYYYEAVNIQNEELENALSEDSTQEEPIEKNILLFIDRGTSTHTTYFENDLKSIPQQKYEETKFLLNGIKNDTLTARQFKPLVHNNKLKGFYEARGDQVRIIYKHLANNKYVICGVFLKKDDVDLQMYLNMVTRYNSSVDYSYLMDTKDEDYNKIVNYINTNKRKADR